MKGLKKGQTLGSEGQKERNCAVNSTVAVLEPEPRTVVEVSENGRPAKPSEDAEECPNWEKGQHRSKPWLRCQGWSLNGHEVCKNCALFQREAPIFRSIGLETITRVVSNARNAMEGAVDSFKDTRRFKQAWQELVEILADIQKNHENRGRDYSSSMRRVEALVPKTFAEESRFLLSRCESLVDRANGDAGSVRNAFHEWEAEVKKEVDRAEVNGVYPRWLFAGKLRYLYQGLSRVDSLNHLAGSIQQGPRRNARRNGGNGWDPNRSWRPARS